MQKHLRDAAACLRLQFCRIRRRLAALLAVGLVAMLLCLAVVALGGTLLTTAEPGSAVIGIVLEDEDARTQAIVDTAAGLPDIKTLATLKVLSAEEAERGLENAELAAAIWVPSGFFESVLSGENLSPRLVLDTSRPLEAIVVIDLVQSAVRMLTTAQKGIAFTAEAYSQSEAATEAGWSEVNYSVNLRFMQWVLGTGSMYRRHEVQATASLPVVQHYLLCAVLFFAMLSVSVLYRFFSFRAQGYWLQRFPATGSSLSLYALAQLLVGWLAVFLLLCLLLAGLAFSGSASQGLATALPAFADMLGLSGAAQTFGFSCAAVPGLLLTSLCITCAGFLLCNTGSILAAVGLNFILSVVGLLVMGGLLPSVLLPPALAALGPYSPLQWMYDSLLPLFGGRLPAGALPALGALSVLLLAACLLFARRRERRGRFA